MQMRFPFKLGEFLATGKPVIASGISDVKILLKHRTEAMIVKPDDIDTIVEAISYLIEHPDKAAEIGNQGRQKAIELFDFKEQGKPLFTFLQQFS